MDTLLEYERSINNIYYYLQYAYICIRARTRVVCILARSSSSTSYSRVVVVLYYQFLAWIGVCILSYMMQELVLATMRMDINTLVLCISDRYSLEYALVDAYQLEQRVQIYKQIRAQNSYDRNCSLRSHAPQLASSTDFPLALDHFMSFSSMSSGEADGSAVTTTVLAATFVSTLETPSTFPNIRLTAEAQPSLFERK